MFESAELGHTIDKQTYETEVPALREALLDVQYELAQQAKFPVVVLVGGVDGAGKGDTVNLLNEWMDPRHIQVAAMDKPTDEELERPTMWRYWRALPPKGKVGVFIGSWYTAPILDRAAGKLKSGKLAKQLEDIVRFERMLSNEGALILKFWFHMSKDAQKKRLKSLEKSDKTSWRVTDTDWERFRMYDTFHQVSEHVLRETSTAQATWMVIEGTDFRYRNLTTGRMLLEALKKRLVHPEPVVAGATAPLQPAVDRVNVIRSLDLSQSLSKKDYEKQLAKYQARLNLLTRDAQFRKQSLIAVFEGSDAAGKGGAIRRISGALDARQYRIIPVAAPTEEERAQPYMWRFWRQLPGRGKVTIFDRSWYGRVLVERVEGYCSEADWMRAYSEINDFEEQLVDSGIVVAKFWLTISAEEQLRRFEERQQIGFKRFKITDEDWRNREKWDDYEHAICDMVDRTSTEIAPWTLVAANDKRFARVKVLKTLCRQLEAALEK